MTIVRLILRATRTRIIIVGTIVLLVLAALMADYVANQRLQVEYSRFTASITAVRVPMSEKEVRQRLGEPSIKAASGDSGSHLVQVFCRRRGAPRALGYRFQFRTWENLVIPVGSEEWFVVCLDGDGKVMDTTREIVQY